jgi:uncharacterized protein YndB with AHSA1/START domain
MTIVATSIDTMTLNIQEEIRVKSSIEATFAALLDEIGPANRGHEDAPMPMVLEAWPGGRWFRDLGSNNGHFWGHVQAIKRPTLLEITGPLMMSFAVCSNIQYRLKAVDGGTLLTFTHTALGLFPDGYREAMAGGWTSLADRLHKRLQA